VVFQKDVRYEGDDDAMVPHQKVTFSTSHEWHLFSKKWTRIPGVGPPQKNENGQSESYQDRAIQELRYGDDEPISDTDQMFGDDEEWFLDRYQLEESDRIVPVTFAANMSYDRVKEEQRTRQKKEGTTSALFLAEPWSPFVTEVSIRYSGWSLRNLAEYNIYKHLTTKLSFGLSTPKFLATGVGLSYVVEKQPIESMIGGFDQKVTATRGVHLSSNLIPRVSSNFSYKLQKIDDDPEAYYESRVGLSYNDRSECWGLNFVRVKEFLKDERQASYQIQFYMTFYGIRRPFDVSPSVMREYEKATGTDDSGA
jgi:hypothetical protein